jgi:hypothetical protein
MEEWAENIKLEKVGYSKIIEVAITNCRPVCGELALKKK